MILRFFYSPTEAAERAIIQNLGTKSNEDFFSNRPASLTLALHVQRTLQLHFDQMN